MRLITREVDYAVRALAFIAAKAPAVVAARDMENEVDVPRPFLRKILQRLNAAGVLRSRKGRGGGFELARAPEEVRLSGLINIFQGPLALGNCVFGKRLCRSHRTCALRRNVGRVERSLASELDRISLKDLI